MSPFSKQLFMSSMPKHDTAEAMGDRLKWKVIDIPDIPWHMSRVVAAYTLHFYAMMVLTFTASDMAGVPTWGITVLFCIFIAVNFIPMMWITFQQARDDHWLFVIQTQLTLRAWSICTLCMNGCAWVWYVYMDAWKAPLDKAWGIAFLSHKKVWGKDVFTRNEDGGIAQWMLAVDLQQTIVAFTLFYAIALIVSLSWHCARTGQPKQEISVQLKVFGLVNRVWPSINEESFWTCNTHWFGMFDWIVVFLIGWLNVSPNGWLAIILLFQWCAWVFLVHCMFSNPKRVSVTLTPKEPKGGWKTSEDNSCMVQGVKSFFGGSFSTLIKLYAMSRLFINILKLYEGTQVLGDGSWLIDELKKGTQQAWIYVFLNVVKLEADVGVVMQHLHGLVQINKVIQAYPHDEQSASKGHFGAPVEAIWKDSEGKSCECNIWVSWNFMNKLFVFDKEK